jgi:K+-transporting ATPase ATPase A chain
MTINGWIQIALYCVIIIAITKPLGGYLARIFTGERTFLSPVLGWLERGIYRLSGVNPNEEQNWLTYAMAMLAFSAAGFIVL